MFWLLSSYWGSKSSPKSGNLLRLVCLIFLFIYLIGLGSALEAKVSFTTDEPAIGCIECVSPDIKERFKVCETNFSLNHTLYFSISGKYDTYYCIISAEDKAGNVNETGGILRITCNNKVTIQPAPVTNLPLKGSKEEPKLKKVKSKNKTRINFPSQPLVMPFSSAKRIPGFDLSLAVLAIFLVLGCEFLNRLR